MTVGELAEQIMALKNEGTGQDRDNTPDPAFQHRLATVRRREEQEGHSFEMS